MNVLEWEKLNEVEKKIKIRELLNLLNRPVKYDVDWYYCALEASIYDGDKTSIYDKIKLISFMGNAFGDSDNKVIELLSKCSEDEFKIYEYVENKIKEFRDDKYISEKEFTNIINVCASELKLSFDYVLRKWQKVDGAKLGVDIYINN